MHACRYVCVCCRIGIRTRTQHTSIADNLPRRLSPHNYDCHTATALSTAARQSSKLKDTKGTCAQMNPKKRSALIRKQQGSPKQSVGARRPCCCLCVPASWRAGHIRTGCNHAQNKNKKQHSSPQPAGLRGPHTLWTRYCNILASRCCNKCCCALRGGAAQRDRQFFAIPVTRPYNLDPPHPPGRCSSCCWSSSS